MNIRAAMSKRGKDKVEGGVEEGPAKKTTLQPLTFEALTNYLYIELNQKTIDIGNIAELAEDIHRAYNYAADNFFNAAYKLTEITTRLNTFSTDKESVRKVRKKAEKLYNSTKTQEQNLYQLYQLSLNLEDCSESNKSIFQEKLNDLISGKVYDSPPLTGIMD